MTSQLVCTCLLLLTSAVQADTGQLDLGGPRKVHARITSNADLYTVTVDLLPVQAFDTATNAQLNRQRAEAYALQALVRHLGRGDNPTLQVSGARVTAGRQQGERYQLTLQVPKNGIILGGKAGAPVAEIVKLDSVLFTRKQDYLTTIRELGKILETELSQAEKAALTRKDEGTALFRALDELSQRARKNHAALLREIDGDLLLSSVLNEPGELRSAVQKQEAQLREHIAAARARQEKRNETEKRKREKQS